MDNSILNVKIDSLKEVSSEIEKHNSVILNDLDFIAKKMFELDEYFDSKTGNEYKVIMNNYLNKTKDYISSRNEYLVNKLNEINLEYWDLYNDIEKTVKGKSMVNVDE